LWYVDKRSSVARARGWWQFTEAMKKQSHLDAKAGRKMGTNGPWRSALQGLAKKSLATPKKRAGKEEKGRNCSKGTENERKRDYGSFVGGFNL